MFKRLFGGDRNANRAITDALYGQIVAAARQPVFYSDWNVPDTPLGRFEMLSLHMFLFQHRLRGEAGVSRDIAQVLTDGDIAIARAGTLHGTVLVAVEATVARGGTL